MKFIRKKLLQDVTVVDNRCKLGVTQGHTCDPQNTVVVVKLYFCVLHL